MDALLRLFPWVLAVLFTAVLTHLAAILILPEIATRNAYLRILESPSISHAQNTRGMIVLPSVQPGEQTIPFRDPALVQGVCVFDLTKAPVRVQTKIVPGRMVSLSFRTAAGRIFYAMTDRGALGGAVDILLVNAAQLAKLEANDDDTIAPGTELRLGAPALKGMIVASALKARPGEKDEAQGDIEGIVCRPEP